MDDIITKSYDGLTLNKFDGTKGEITAIISSVGNADVVGDIMAPGAFDDFIKSFNDEGAPLPMFLQHSPLNIIGEWNNIRMKGNNLMADGTIYLETSGGADANSLISRGMVGSTSIGFRSSDYEWEDNGGRTFNKIDLVETSLVISPANPKARITDVKNDDGLIDFVQVEKLLRDAGLSRKESKALLSQGKEALRDVELEKNAKEKLAGSLIDLWRK